MKFSLFILNNLNILFFVMMITSSILSISSSNWFGAWMGLELNMLSFIPFMVEQKNILSNESALKYFLVQASASAMFIMFCLLNSFTYILFSNFNFLFLQNLLLMIPLLIKLGAAPFQTWFIMIMDGMNWFKCFLLAGWQKITPLFILSYIYINNNFLLLFSVSSLIVGSIGGLTQTSLRKLLAFSSVNHIGWLLASLTLSKNLTFIYFIFYFFMNSLTILNLNVDSIFLFNQMYSKPQFLSLAISLLSLGGLPPFLGFLPKWMIIQTLVYTEHYLLSFIMIMTALITLFFYLRLIFSTLVILSATPKWTPAIPEAFPLTLLNSLMVMITISGLMMFNLILT